MNCMVEGCTGEYRETTTAEVFRRDGRLAVVDNIPVFVCNVCGDTFLSGSTTDRIARILDEKPEGATSAPVYDYTKVPEKAAV